VDKPMDRQDAHPTFYIELQVATYC
jgi:hypothetical protein